jgi:hypothetical protein
MNTSYGTKLTATNCFSINDTIYAISSYTAVNWSFFLYTSEENSEVYSNSIS